MKIEPIQADKRVDKRFYSINDHHGNVARPFFLHGADVFVPQRFIPGWPKKKKAARKTAIKSSIYLNRTKTLVNYSPVIIFRAHYSPQLAQRFRIFFAKYMYHQIFQAYGICLAECETVHICVCLCRRRSMRRSFSLRSSLAPSVI